MITAAYLCALQNRQLFCRMLLVYCVYIFNAISIIWQACLSLALSPTLALAATASDDGEKVLPWLVAGYSDGTVRLFDLNRVEMTLKMHPNASATTAVCFSADG